MAPGHANDFLALGAILVYAGFVFGIADAETVATTLLLFAVMALTTPEN